MGTVVPQNKLPGTISRVVPQNKLPQRAGIAVPQNKLPQRMGMAVPQNKLPSSISHTSFLDTVKGIGKGIYEGARNAGAGIVDVATRLPGGPVENIRSGVIGWKNLLGGNGDLTKRLTDTQNEIIQDKARPLLWEQATGNKVTKDTGGIDWNQGRKFIGDAASAPAYFYSPIKGVLGAPIGGLTSRILARSAEQLPVAGVNTAIQQFEQGDMKNVARNFATNELALAGMSNVFGEGTRYVKNSKIKSASQGLDEEAKKFVSGNLTPRKVVPPEKLPPPQDLNQSTYTDIQPPVTENVKPPLIQEGGKDIIPGSEFKKRGFVDTVQSSSNTDARLKMLVDDNYIPQPNDQLVTHATNLIKENIDNAKIKALKGDDNLAVATASELIKHYQNIGDFSQAAEITKAVAQKLTEHGRAIQAASLYNKLTPEGIKMFAQKELSKEGLVLTKEQGDELAKMASEANLAQGEDKILKTGAMLQRVGEFVPSKGIDQLTMLWKAGLLTNPTTHIANMAGNATMSGLEMAKDIPATVFDKVASLFTGKRTKTVPNILEYLRGAGQGARKAYVFMKTGVDIDQSLGKYDYHQVNLPPILKQYAQTIFRALGAEDKVFKNGLLQKSLKELATVEGINKGLKGAELSAFSKKLYQNPTTDMVKNATEDALYGTFNNPNKLADAINQLKSHNNATVRGFTEFIAPFSKTPSNIAGRILDYSPAGFIKAGMQGFGKAGQRKVVESLGRATIGSGIIGAGYGLGKAGMMTGNYPTNPTEQNLWDVTGKQPGSLNAGGNWQSLNRVSPVGNLLSIGSGMADLGRMKPEDVPMAMAGVAGKNLLGQTYLQGVSGMLNAFQDPKRYGDKWTTNLAQSMIPSIINSAVRATDTTPRQKNSAMEAIQARIPGESQNLLPKVNTFGETQQYSDSGLGQTFNPFFNPFNPSAARDTPLTDEINRLYQNYSGVTFGDASKSVSVPNTGIKIDMTPEEYTRMQQQSGGMTKNILTNLIKTPQYQKLSDYDKSKLMNDTISKIRQIWGIQNLGKLSNGEKQFREQLQKQIQNRTPNPYYK